VGKGKGHIPLRTCISCGEKRNKKELIRLVLDRHDRVIRDDLGRGQGRGAYICKRDSCLEKLSKHKKLKRVFRSENNIILSPELKL
jgi:predicted RNA-binding protein YlxR (DUF448 family)